MPRRSKKKGWWVGNDYHFMDTKDSQIEHVVMCHPQFVKDLKAGKVIVPVFYKRPVKTVATPEPAPDASEAGNWLFYRLQAPFLSCSYRI